MFGRPLYGFVEADMSSVDTLEAKFSFILIDNKMLKRELLIVLCLAAQ